MEIKEEVQRYYGETLKSSQDLQTNACSTGDVYPRYIKKIIADIHPEVLSRYYGCGLSIPLGLEGAHVLDLGSGAGRDCFLLSSLVGETGRVTGVEFTDNQLAIAEEMIPYHQKAFGYAKPNVRFLKGDIEDLAALGLQSEEVDVIISNCVVNLVQDKQAVLNEAYRTLKVGGEFYFSDVYSSCRIPEALQKDAVLYGECLSGALYWNDFLNIAKKAGFRDPRVVEASPITIGNQELREKVGDIEFYSVTYRLFKIEDLESDCEDYGQAVSYNGSLEFAPLRFTLDDHHHFPKGKVVSVCGNTYDMLAKTRFKDSFDFYGDRSTHYGIFEGCGEKAPFQGLVQESAGAESSCC